MRFVLGNELFGLNSSVDLYSVVYELQTDAALLSYLVSEFFQRKGVNISFSDMENAI